ncbi:hypothetical protein [Paenibacillus sp. PDC88]|uniref:Fur-regulated basic protein B n=2 Tax=Bacillati TaxID=1783272 RepID=A0ABW3PZS0_9BACL|nr:hypothetical protein [Paenibacillus sp. PDC88]SDX63212.1 hypothetical protein SAMN05518848_11089 [Paenibacillus sp. PDC88]
MVLPKAKEPKKINFVSQREIVEKNRIHREEVLRVLDEIKAAQQEAAASNESKPSYK